MSVKKYTKADMIDALYEKTGMNRSEIKVAVDLFINGMKAALARGNVIELRGFGTFKVKVRPARLRARNPKTGEKIVIHPHGTVVFRSGRELKQAVWKIKDKSESLRTEGSTALDDEKSKKNGK